MEIYPPLSRCLQCKYYSLTYSSLLDLHICKDCAVEIRHPFIETTLSAFSIKKKEPSLITCFNRVFCVSCHMIGGIYFKFGSIYDYVYCKKCDVEIAMPYFVDAKVNAMRTKIMEDIYDHKFCLSRAWSQG